MAGLLITAGLAGCVDDDQPQVRFETTMGDFTIELWPDEAPKTVENFLRYVNEGHYDGLTFHRIAPGFVVQGGGYLPDHETLRPTAPPIENEAKESVPNEKWTLSMARTPDPDSATSQFFINLDDNENLDKTASSAGYAVFGKVISGTEVIEAMTAVEKGESFGAGGFFPAEPIVIEKATQIQGEAPEPRAPPALAEVEADLITAGAWRITDTQDSILVWATNHGGTAADVEWGLRGADGDLPDGWNVTFDAPTSQVPPAAGDAGSAHTLAHITVPEDTEGDFELLLTTGHGETPVIATVELVHDRLSEAGDAVNVGYRGTCTKDGEEFDAGEFPLTLGQGKAITGFDLGLVGMGLEEQATLMIPAPLGYGETRGPCAGRDPADLTFEVTLLSFDE